MKYHEDVERIFSEDIRDKKKAGRGVFSMRGKGVKHGISGALRTPYHYMTTKEKRKLNGEVEVFNMFQTILTWNEFQTKDKETQKELMTKWREIYPNQKIMDELGIGRERPFNTQNFADLVNGLGCPRKKRSINSKSKPRKSKKSSIQKEETQLIDLSTTEDKPAEQQKDTIHTLITEGLHLSYNGKYDAESLNKLFTKLQLLIDGEPNKYYIALSLSEIAKD